MAKRQLTEKETEWNTKSLERLETDLEYIDKVSLPDVDLTLETAELVVRKQVQDKKKQRKELEQKRQEIEESVKELKDQLENGVEEKEENEDDTSSEDKE